MNRIVLFALISFVFVLLCQESLSAQEYRSETRKGNEAFMRKGNFEAALTHYKAALRADSLNIPAIYNMAYVLHADNRDSSKRAEKDSLALNYLDKLAEKVKGSKYEFDYNFNKGVICIDMKDWQGAVDAFKQCLKLAPGDMKALENYVYAKEHLPKDNSQQDQQQNQQDQSGDQNKNDQNKNDQNKDGQNKDDQNKNDQNKNDQNKNDQNKDDQNKDDQNKDGQNKDDQNKEQQNQSQGQPNKSKISQQAAQQMLQAIQDNEKKTQDKVNKKKAAVMQSNQKQKNW